MANPGQHISIKNPPNPDDPLFKIAVSDVAGRISRHLNNDEQIFLMFGVQLVHQSDRKQLTNIQQSRSNLQDKCREVLELWARRSESRWEDVIAQLRVIGLSRLADELTDELTEDLDRSKDRSQPSASASVSVSVSVDWGLRSIQGSKPFDCLEMAKYLKKNLPSLSNLPYNNMKLHLVANDVITHQEKKKIDQLIGEDQIAEVFDILQISLKNKSTTKFKGFLQAMEESGDKLLEETARSLGGSKSVPDS